MRQSGRESERLLRTKEVAQWLGISSRTVRLWAECSELPAVKIGRQWRFQREAVLEWMEKSARPIDRFKKK